MVNILRNGNPQILLAIMATWGKLQFVQIVPVLSSCKINDL